MNYPASGYEVSKTKLLSGTATSCGELTLPRLNYLSADISAASSTSSENTCLRQTSNHIISLIFFQRHLMNLRRAFDDISVCVFMQYAWYQCLVRQPAFCRLTLNMHYICFRYPNIYSLILAQSRLCVFTIPRDFFFNVWNRLKSTPLISLKNFFFLFLYFQSSRPFRYFFVALRLGIIVFKKITSWLSIKGTRYA